MNSYIVVWLREGTENTSIIDNVNNEQEAVNEVRRIHVCSNVVAVGLMKKNWK